jgi:hypothetical protein
MFVSRLKYFLTAVSVLGMTSIPMHASTIFSENFEETTAMAGVVRRRLAV